MTQVNTLLISSDRLNPIDSFNSSFEVSLAGGLASEYMSVRLLSVFLLTPLNLFKALFIKTFFSFKKNEIAERFSHLQLAQMFFGFFLTGRRITVFAYHINGMPLYEGVGISSVTPMDFPQYSRVWLNVGTEAFQRLYKRCRPDILHGHSRFYLGAALANSLSRLYDLPYVVTEHSSFYFRGLVPDLLLSSIRHIYEEANAATAVSSALQRQVWHVTGARKAIQVVGNALPAVYNTPLPEILSENRPFTVVSVARLDDNKNHDLLIRAFALAAIPGAILVIAGDGETKSRLQRLSNFLGLVGTVQFTGKLNQNAVRDLLVQSSVLVVSSRVETFSVAAIEAHACGIPVVSTPCGGPADLIDGDNGILLNGFTKEEMAQALRQVFLSRGRYNRHQIRENVLRRFGAKTIADHYVKIYQEVLTTPGSVPLISVKHS